MSAGGGGGFGSVQIVALWLQEDKHLATFLSTQVYLSSIWPAFSTA